MKTNQEILPGGRLKNPARSGCEEAWVSKRDRKGADTVMDRVPMYSDAARDVSYILHRDLPIEALEVWLGGVPLSYLRGQWWIPNENIEELELEVSVANEFGEMRTLMAIPVHGATEYEIRNHAFTFFDEWPGGRSQHENMAIPIHGVPGWPDEIAFMKALIEREKTAREIMEPIAKKIFQNTEWPSAGTDGSEWFLPVPCECGVSMVGGVHSDWCPHVGPEKPEQPQSSCETYADEFAGKVRALEERLGVRFSVSHQERYILQLSAETRIDWHTYDRIVDFAAENDCEIYWGEHEF